MSEAIAVLLSFAVFLAGILGITNSTIKSVSNISQAQKEAQILINEKMRTEISIISTEVDATGAQVEAVVRNCGEVKLYEFENWDVIVEYYRANGDLIINRLDYASTNPGANEWTVEGIYLDAQNGISEIFEPGILNPDEEAKLTLLLNPPVGPDTTNRLVIGTENGVISSAFFSF